MRCILLFTLGPTYRHHNSGSVALEMRKVCEECLWIIAVLLLLLVLVLLSTSIAISLSAISTKGQRTVPDTVQYSTVEFNIRERTNSVHSKQSVALPIQHAFINLYKLDKAYCAKHITAGKVGACTTMTNLAMLKQRQQK